MRLRLLQNLIDILLAGSSMDLAVELLTVNINELRQDLVRISKAERRVQPLKVKEAAYLAGEALEMFVEAAAALPQPLHAAPAVRTSPTALAAQQTEAAPATAQPGGGGAAQPGGAAPPGDLRL